MAVKVQPELVDFDILEVARRCGVTVLRPLPDGQWLARCPFCGDSQKSKSHGHLYLKPATGEFKCHRCGEGGYAVGFYARIRGVDTKAAYRELAESAGCVPEIRYDPRKVIQVAPEEAMAPIERRHEVYTALLSLLALEPRHRADLLKRGLPEPVIVRNSYRSMPSKKIGVVCKELAARFDLRGIPGFYKDERGQWDMVLYQGYLIPVRDPQGRIQGMQVRLDPNKEGKKYVWLSSRARPEGCGARRWVHVAEPLCPPPPGRAWITEGPLKADIAAAFLGVRFLAVPGVAAWKNVVEVARELGIKKAVLAYDADISTNPDVSKSAEELAGSLRGSRIQVVPANWPPVIGKGIDDACVTLTRSRREVAEAVFLDDMKVTRTRTVTETVRVEGSVVPLLGRLMTWLQRPEGKKGQ